MASREGTGGLWRNQYKGGNSARPDYVGQITLGGVSYPIAAWTNHSTSGGKPSITIRLNEQKEVVKTTKPRVKVPLPKDFDDDIPF